jgi:hypothetical protein
MVDFFTGMHTWLCADVQRQRLRTQRHYARLQFPSITLQYNTIQPSPHAAAAAFLAYQAG